MKVEVSAKFDKDVGRLTQSKVKAKLANLIEFMESANHLNEIPALKKLKGFKNAYRIRLGNYGLGFVFESGIIKLGRFLGRKDNYKYFP